MGMAGRLFQGLERLRLETQFIDVQHRLVLVENPQNHLLPKISRQHRNAEIHFPLTDPDFKTAVLGNAVLGDIEIRHDLDPGYDACMHGSAPGKPLPPHPLPHRAAPHAWASPREPPPPTHPPPGTPPPKALLPGPQDPTHACRRR